MSDLAFAALFSDTPAMSEIPEWKMQKVPKWPFVLIYLILLVAAAAVVYCAPHPISETIGMLATAAVVFGSIIGCLPFYWDYQATGRLIDVEAVIVA